MNNTVKEKHRLRAVLFCEVKNENKTEKEKRGDGAVADRDQRLYGIRTFDSERRNAVFYDHSDEYIRIELRERRKQSAKTDARIVRRAGRGDSVRRFGGAVRR